MSDDRIKILFDYKKPDAAILITYKMQGGSMFLGGEPSISVIEIFIGEKAIALYSELSGKSVEEIEKEAWNE